MEGLPDASSAPLKRAEEPEEPEEPEEAEEAEEAEGTFYSYEDAQRILAPPFSDQATVPKHWPQGLELCNLRRVLWLPPHWGQAWKQDSKGFRRKMFVAPDTLGSKVVYFKSHVQDITGLDLQPVDHNGHPIPSRFPDHWPNWLPRDWEIGFAGFSSEFAPSFRSASGQVFGTEEEAKQHLKKLGISLKPVPDKKAKASPTGSAGPGKVRQRKPKQEPEEPERKSRRLRKLTAEECVVCEDLERELPEPPKELEPPPKPLPGHLRRLRRVGDRKRLEVKTEEATGKVKKEDPSPPPLYNMNSLSEEEREYLHRHPLHIKIHKRGYPIPIGDLDILALRPFIPPHFGGAGQAP